MSPPFVIVPLRYMLGPAYDDPGMAIEPPEPRPRRPRRPEREDPPRYSKSWTEKPKLWS